MIFILKSGELHNLITTVYKSAGLLEDRKDHIKKAQIKKKKKKSGFCPYVEGNIVLSVFI